MLFRIHICIVAAMLAGMPALAQVAPAQSWENDARRHIGEGEWDAAIGLLDHVLEKQPDALDARLLRAISYREKADVIFDEVRAQYYLDEGELKSMWRAARSSARGEVWDLEVGRDYDVTRAMFDFEYVLERDSAFDGTLSEYAKLWHDHHVFDRAIDLGEAQIKRRPDYTRGHEELLEAFRHYVATVSPKKALAWLRARGTSYAEYFVGEVYRRNGEYARADSLFAALLDAGTDVPREAVLLSQARVRIGQERFRAASELVEEALKFNDLSGARVLYRDFIYIMDEEEYLEARTLRSVEEYAGFYERLWARRNPAPASRVNWRLVEHYRRLVLAERDFEYYGPRPSFSGFSGPTPGGTGGTDRSRLVGTQVTFPPMHSEVHGFNDKGLIFIRHGEPDERVVTQPRPGVDLNESWRYADEGMVFHFFVSNESGVAHSWPLVSYLGNCYMADDRRHWGGLHAQIAPPLQVVDTRFTGQPSDPCGTHAEEVNELDLYQGTQMLAAAGQEMITTGLTTDRHTWTARQVDSFDYPFAVATFRGSDGMTDVHLYFALPVGRFSEAVSSTVLPVEIGLALHDTSWNATAVERDLRQYEPTDDPSRAAFEEMHVAVPPDSYSVSLHSELVGSSMLGGYRFGRRIPDYDRPEPMMSDVVLAYDIRPKSGHVPSARRSLDFVPNPFHRFRTDQPVHVYFELYRLALDDEDLARYEVTYLLEREKKGGWSRLFGRRASSLSVSAEFEDETPSPIVYSQVDVSALDQGAYTLVVHVKDSVSGFEFVRRLPLELAEPTSETP